MKNCGHKRNILINSIIFFLIINLLVTSFSTSSGSPINTPNDTPHKPAYIQGKDDLIKVQDISRSFSSSQLSPSSVDVNIIELLQQLNESLILGYLENLTSFGPRETGTEACDQAAFYIFDTFQDMGLTVRYHNYTDEVVSGSNIEATLYGSNTTNIFIICGHYDTVSDGPGADDDGSGVAAVLAAAEIMRNYEFMHTVRFVTFSGEEQGLIGSRHYAEDAYNNNDPIIAVLNADMIGFAPSGSDGTKGKIFENTASEWIVEFTQEINQLYTEYIGIQLFPQGETWGSDHYYFWEYGYDAVFYHEYNFNDYYHSADDTIANMNITYLTRFSRLILATLAELAQQPRPVLVITEITGGLGISAQISNIGDEPASSVNVTITITGGLLGFINISKTTSSQILQPQDVITSKAMLLRLGQIYILVAADASNADKITKHATGFLLGPFVLNVSVSP